MCRNPYTTSDGKAYGCGQCMPCRVNRRRKWQARIMLEAGEHKDNTFLTLTYDDANLPRSASGLPTLAPKDLRNFLDRMRFHYGELGHRGLRFYAVGEYGDVTNRPHYHLALFNHPNCAYGMSVYGKQRAKCCPVCELVRRIWGKGHVFLGTLERDSAGYVASYVTKAMTKSDDPRLGDRYPEFPRMSRMPGIGATAMFDIASELLKHGLDKDLMDVPSEIKSGGKSMPLDRYLRRKLRLYIGRSVDAPEAVLEEFKAELSSLFERAKDATRNNTVPRKEFFKALILDENENDFRRFENKRKIFNQRRNAL